MPFIVVFNKSIPSILAKTRPKIKEAGNARVRGGWGGEGRPEGVCALD